MKPSIIALPVLALLLTVTPAVATLTQEPPQASKKNLCLLWSEDCPDKKLTITEQIAALKREIALGTTVYTPKELQRLRNKLDEYQFFYDRLMFGNSGK
ncbi:hypothetical protein GURASL_35230 [Geotalea uraniireducens]|uniref:Uncharacterized protein n=1 Tax=Geotalea uraniireducens TaxID=351604 RepID=A0ABM8EQ69_9BACT|nr:hypothetical protein [Geotalea uraniireducens]BDV44600.1 hypothetical protein GURASL_35230 [Geotalea uraniireducens]